ncbi:unnamed protein product [Moneuplotes crassus]|uniref:Uncharacterized protein n=1 Tax=Euplotes crassus TaxID=5936 RepID=A0AAD1UEK1_EUPCR|nr:unnamed protein product [Moneuplotes crassus]
MVLDFETRKFSRYIFYFMLLSCCISHALARGGGKKKASTGGNGNSVDNTYCLYVGLDCSATCCIQQACGETLDECEFGYDPDEYSLLYIALAVIAIVIVIPVVVASVVPCCIRACLFLNQKCCCRSRSKNSKEITEIGSRKGNTTTQFPLNSINSDDKELGPMKNERLVRNQDSFSLDNLALASSNRSKGKGNKVQPHESAVLNKGYINNDAENSAREVDSYLDEKDYIVRWDKPKKLHEKVHFSGSLEDLSSRNYDDIHASDNIKEKKRNNLRETANPSFEDEGIRIDDDMSFTKKETILPRDAPSMLISRAEEEKYILDDTQLIDEFDAQKNLNFTNDSLDNKLLMMEGAQPPKKKTIPPKPRRNSIDKIGKSRRTEANEKLILEELERWEAEKKKSQKRR